MTGMPSRKFSAITWASRYCSRVHGEDLVHRRRRRARRHDGRPAQRRHRRAPADSGRRGVRDRCAGAGACGRLVLVVLVGEAEVDHGLLAAGSTSHASVCAPSASRLTGGRPIPGDCRADPQVCRALQDRLAEVVPTCPPRSQWRPGAIRCTRSDSSAHARERRPGRLLRAARPPSRPRRRSPGVAEHLLGERVELRRVRRRRGRGRR